MQPGAVVAGADKLANMIMQIMIQNISVDEVGLA